MELTITGQNIEVLAEVRERIERKVDKLRRHLLGIALCKVELVQENTRSPAKRFVAQVTIDANGVLLRGEERGDDLFNAIDKAVDVVDRQIERYKGKLQYRGGSVAKGRVLTTTTALSSIEKLVKVKKFLVLPMTTEDAIDQMEMLGHDFFLFQEEKTLRLSVVYRRKDGNYSLIEPEVEK